MNQKDKSFSLLQSISAKMRYVMWWGSIVMIWNDQRHLAPPLYHFYLESLVRMYIYLLRVVCIKLWPAHMVRAVLRLLECTTWVNVFKIKINDYCMNSRWWTEIHRSVQVVIQCAWIPWIWLNRRLISINPICFKLKVVKWQLKI